MNIQGMKVSVIIPTLNEAEGIGAVLQKVKEYVDDILVIDGNSRDRTAQIAKDLGARVVLQNGKGKGAALCEAFRLVDGDLILIMDGDGSMNPTEIPLFVDALKNGADVAKGSRFVAGGNSTDLTLTRKLGNRILLFLVNLIWSTRYTDLCYGFGAFKREALQRLLPFLGSKSFEIEAEICIRSKKCGLKVAEVPSVETRRTYGKSNLKTFRDGLLIFKKVIIELLTA